MDKKYTYLIVIFFIFSSYITYSQIIGNDFINFDDNEYIVENYSIQSGFNTGSIKWAFTSVVQGNWHPLTWLSHMLDWNLFGANASGHHLVSVLLHIGAVIFLFLFLNKTTNNLWPAVFASALFALHPLRVESVAWAAERKDVLSMFFGMACLYAYAFYAEKNKSLRYLLCLILFVLSLMSKSMLVTLPFIMMLLDYWPLQRWQKAIDEQGKRLHSARCLIWEKVPFLLFTITSSIITFCVQNKAGAISSGEKLAFIVRGANAIVSYVAYLGKTFWPINLAVFYPYEYPLPLWKVLISGIILILFTLAVLYYIRKLPFLFVGWFWYLGTLIPVIGLVQVGNQAIADRYTYLPSIGIAVMLAWGIPTLIKSEEIRKKILFPMGIAFLTILSVLTCQQCGYWKNNFELFNHAVLVTKDNYVAHNNVGLTLAEEGKINGAFYHYNKAIHIKPDYADAYYNRGIIYDERGQYQLAIEDYNQAIRLQPNFARAYNNSGAASLKLGQNSRAIDDFNKAIQLKQDFADAYHNRGVVYAKLGQYQLAIEDYNKAIRLRPDYISAYYNRGTAYNKLGQNQRAAADWNQASGLSRKKSVD